MEKRTTNLKRYGWQWIMSLVALCILAFPFSGCTLTVENTGWLQENAEITSVFESGEVLPGYRYYYNGPEAEPFVILGIRRDYHFEQGLWKEIDLTENRLNEWLEALDNPHRELSIQYYGSYIVDRSGDKVAIWYSFVDQATIKIDPEKKWMTVHIPTNPSHISDASPRKKGNRSGK